MKNKDINYYAPFFGFLIFSIGINSIVFLEISFSKNSFRTNFEGLPAIIIGIILIFYSIWLLYTFYREYILFLNSKDHYIFCKRCIKLLILVPLTITFLEPFVSIIYGDIHINSAIVLLIFFFVSLIFVNFNIVTDIYKLKIQEKANLLKALNLYCSMINFRVREKMSVSKIPYYRALFRQLKEQHDEFYKTENMSQDSTEKTDSEK